MLDAPQVSFIYANIIDWGKNNTIAIGLGQFVYLWAATAGTTEELMRFRDGTPEHVSCVKWSHSGPNTSGGGVTGSGTKHQLHVLVIGSSIGHVLVWNVVEKRILRRIVVDGNAAVVSLAINDQLLSVGLKSGVVEHHDIRCETSLLSVNRSHSEVGIPVAIVEDFYTVEGHCR